MKGFLKGDWEIVRIFLILAILTAAFVWGTQSLLLAPASTSLQKATTSSAVKNP